MSAAAPPGPPQGHMLSAREQDYARRATTDIPSSSNAGIGGASNGAGFSGTSRDEGPKFWLDAWHDPLAKLDAYGPQVACCDLFGDGENRLIVASNDKRMRVWKGSALASEHTLLDLPTAICSHYLEGTNGQPERIPNLAVACGASVFMYRNLKPYYKYSLPVPDVHPGEAEIWEKAAAGRLDPTQVRDALTGLRTGAIPLTQGSINLISVEEEGMLETATKAWSSRPLAEQSVVTAMCSIDTYPLGSGRLDSSLVLGTEDGHVLLMDKSATRVQRDIAVGAPIFALHATGSLQTEHRLAIATRGGRILIAVNGEVRTNLTIQLEAYVVDVVSTSNGIFVILMNDTLAAYGWNGERLGSKHLPAAPVAIDALPTRNLERESSLVVGLASGAVQTFRDLQLLNTTQLPGCTAPTAVRCGSFGREERALIAVLSTGAINIKFLPRSVRLEAPLASSTAALIPEAERPLPVPKKTRFFLELMEREKEEFLDMHQLFQRDLFMLRVRAARSYVKVLTDGQGPVSYAAGQNLRMQTQLMGLGPNFKLRVSLQNGGTKPVRDIVLVARADEALYQVFPLSRKIPALTPGIEYNMDLSVVCLNPELGMTGDLSVVTYTTESPVPLMMSITKLPMSDIAFDEN